MGDIVAEIRTMPGVRMVLSTAGGGWIDGVSEGRAYIRLGLAFRRPKGFAIR